MCPAAIRENLLPGNCPTRIAREKQNDLSDVAGLQQIRNALRTLDQFLHVRIHVIAQLPIGHDPTGRNGIHTNTSRPEFARERACAAKNRALGRDVSAHVRRRSVESDGSDIDDRAALHVRHTFASSDEDRAKVYGDEFIKTRRIHLLQRNARINGRVVNDNINVRAAFDHTSDPFYYVSFVGNVDAGEAAAGVVRLNAFASGWIQVAEFDDASLRAESSDGGGADSIRATGQEDDFILQIAVTRHAQRIVDRRAKCYAILQKRDMKAR